VTFAAQNTNDSLLVCWREAGEECCLSAASAQFCIRHLSTSSPNSIGSARSPTSRHTLRLIRSLSPVRIFTVTPCLCSASMAVAAVGLGGSRMRHIPSAQDLVHPLLRRRSSRSTPLPQPPKPGIHRAQARVLSFNSFISVGSMVTTSRQAQIESIDERSPPERPWVRRMAFPSGLSTSTDIMRRVKSNGISSSFLYFSIRSFS